MLGPWWLGTNSVALIYIYLVGFDFLNAWGHCNFEVVPYWYVRIWLASQVGPVCCVPETVAPCKTKRRNSYSFRAWGIVSPLVAYCARSRHGDPATVASDVTACGMDEALYWAAATAAARIAALTLRTSKMPSAQRARGFEASQRWCTCTPLCRRWCEDSMASRGGSPWEVRAPARFQR